MPCGQVHRFRIRSRAFPLQIWTYMRTKSSSEATFFYLVPDISSGRLRCFFYFEDNLFAKDSDGELTLLESSLHLLSQ